MEDIFQYIVIIGAIIAAVIKSVSKEKQKKATPKVHGPIETTMQRDEKNPSPASEWEKWFDLIEEKIEPQKQEPVVVAPAVQDVHSLSSTTKKRPKIQVKEIETLNNIEHTDNPPQIALDSMDEIRKAIIYSEIIQRKY